MVWFKILLKVFSNRRVSGKILVIRTRIRALSGSESSRARAKLTTAAPQRRRTSRPHITLVPLIVQLTVIPKQPPALTQPRLQ
jgi:hypothetical protein